jgi:hypothetical protein
MTYKFSLIYELDTTVACAVAAYLDAEHYAYLHSKYSPSYEVLAHDGRTLRVKQTWRYAGWTFGQVYTAEYVPPARFIQDDISPSPRWRPSVHHFIRTRTDLRYYPNATGTATVSHLEVQLQLPFWLWPFRHLLERKLSGLKREKDQEDMEMLQRRARIFGRGNIRSYLADHQFMFHKDDFVACFGDEARLLPNFEQPSAPLKQSITR